LIFVISQGALNKYPSYEVDKNDPYYEEKNNSFAKEE